MKPLVSFPVSSSINVDRLEGPLSEKSGSPRRSAFSGRAVNGNRYSRVSEAVTGDRRLDDIDVRVYNALTSGITSGNISTVSTRRVHEIIGKSRSAIVQAIKKLCECGHVEKADVKSGMTACYSLTAPVFNAGKVSRSGKDTSVVVETRKPKLTKCAECHKPRVLRATGWCKKCEDKVEAERTTRVIARDEIRKSQVA